MYKVTCPTCQEDYCLESKIINKSVCCSNCEKTFFTPEDVLHKWSGRKDWHRTNLPTRVWAFVCFFFILMNIGKPFLLKRINGLNHFLLETKPKPRANLNFVQNKTMNQ